MENKLEALECHFTWNLNPGKNKYFHLRDKLEDLITDGTCAWMGHVYNLLGFVFYMLGSKDKALINFSRAKDSFSQLSNEEGPWLVVNYGNLAWLHHDLGEEAKAQSYLSKVDALMGEHPQPEVYAEKAWNLMMFGKKQKLLAKEYFSKAIEMQPDRVEWQTSHAVNLIQISMDLKEDVSPDGLEEIRKAKTLDPESRYLAAFDLSRRADEGEDIKDEARELARKIFDKPLTEYSGIEPLHSLFRKHVSIDELITFAEEALQRYPGSRFNKRCTCNFYKTKILNTDIDDAEVIDRSIRLHLEVIDLSPETSWKKQIYLAAIYAKTNQQDKAKQKFEELLQKVADQDLEGQQMLYHYYAGNLFFNQKNREKSTKYLMKAAEIAHDSFYRTNSINQLEKI
uniref:Uncharacterized protein n=1 Tax=Oryzias melastigma TaxID=30732 RepID=A0A3B3DLG2_ORYME